MDLNIINFKSNFSSTYLSIATLLTSNYPVHLIVQNILIGYIFSNMMSRTNNFFYSLMDKINANFMDRKLLGSMCS